MNTNDVGRFISELRKEKGFTQKELAEKLSITDKAVSKWETGRSAPDISLLVPLSELLGVSVIEILSGRRIEKESYPVVGDEVIVETMKVDKRKKRLSVVVSVAVTLFIIMLAASSYPAYHFFTSVPIDDESAILEESERYAEHFEEVGEEMEIVKSLKKGDYFFYLLQSENRTSLRVFERNKIFKNRISLRGGTLSREPNKIEVYSTGGPGPINMNVFFGYGMTDKQYYFYYRGTTTTVPVEDELVLDVLLDIDDSFSYASASN